LATSPPMLFSSKMYWQACMVRSSRPVLCPQEMCRHLRFA
jgi:hypothetical protein